MSQYHSISAANNRVSVAKLKLGVFCCVHTYPEVAKLTIGSFLRAHPDYEIELHVGLHSNYSDYCKDLSLFKDLKGIGQLHLVDEIDWIGQYNACWYRYSVMHAKNLENLMKQAKYSDFDYAVILDHDLHVKADFVTPLLSQSQDRDLFGAFFEDHGTLLLYTTAHKEDVYRAPKISIWHTVLSRRLFDEIIKTPNLIYPQVLHGDHMKPYVDAYRPKEDRPIFVDTFAGVYNMVAYGNAGFRAAVVASSFFKGKVEHFYGTSFNYGYWTQGNAYPAHIDRIIEIYKKEFPNGLTFR
jgi:hypothetical protein